MDADEYREIRVDFKSSEVYTDTYGITTELNRLSNFVGVSYPSNTSILYTADSNLDSRQATKNHTLNKSMWTSYGIPRLSGEYSIKTMYIG